MATSTNKIEKMAWVLTAYEMALSAPHLQGVRKREAPYDMTCADGDGCIGTENDGIRGYQLSRLNLS